MADMSKYLKVLGSLAVALLVLMIIFASTILIGSKFKEQVCEQEGGTYSAGACTPAGTAFNATDDVLDEIIGVVGWIGIIVIIAIAGMLVIMAKGFWNNKEGM